MFSLFSQLPIELRRKIWLETLGPMTLQFTMFNPDVLKEMNVTGQQLAASYGIKHNLRDRIRALQASKDPDFDIWPSPTREFTTSAQGTAPDSPESVYWDASIEDDWVAEDERINNRDYACCFVHGFGHYGYVALPDGSSRMSYVVESTPAYRACKESRAFLAHIFAEPVREGGGLPSWFRFNMDTIRVHGNWLHRIGNHPWYLQTQHLYIDLHTLMHEYFDPAWRRYNMAHYNDDGDFDYSRDRPEKGHDWIIQHLTQLKDLAIELRTFETEVCEDDWFGMFDSIYYHEPNSYVLPFPIRVLSPRIPGKEWLTAHNYLRIQKAVYIKDLGPLYPNGNWTTKEYRYPKVMETMVTATDEELSDPEAFHAKHLSTWQSCIRRGSLD